MKIEIARKVEAAFDTAVERKRIEDSFPLDGGEDEVIRRQLLLLVKLVEAGDWAEAADFIKERYTGRTAWSEGW